MGQGMKHGKVERKVEVISLDHANKFFELFDFPSKTSLSVFGTATATAELNGEKTNPNIAVLGCDQNYLSLSSYELSQGRNFSEFEEKNGLNVVICGSDIIKTLFVNGQSPIGQTIDLAGQMYLIVGVLKEKGNTFGFAGDNQCLVPVSNVKKVFGDHEKEYQISVAVNTPEELEEASERAIEVMRIARADKPGAENSFEIRMSNGLVEKLMGLISGVTLGGMAIGIITLIGAGIGLMNIMLVSVNERTREIGVRKSLGATSKIIRQQFLIESIIIGQWGGWIGTVFGVLVGNVVSLVIGVGFTVPWGWLIFAVLLSFITSVASGYYPAKRAAALDPIEALRYE
jgi:putative ABC transport system permease protein